jgi:putative methyltransferase
MLKKVYFFQPQYATIVKNVHQYWIPYSAGCVWAYCQQFPEVVDHWQLGGFYYKRDPIADVLKTLDNPSVAAFSCYVWNEEYNLQLAQAIKQTWPNCAIVFGGPQTGSNHLKHDFIDSIVLAEGEMIFLEILRTLADNRPLEIFYKRQRMENLTIPSPYTLGLFDDIIESADPSTTFQTVVETNRGCPYACTYCDWGGLTYSKIKNFDLDKIEQELIWIKNNPISVVFIADANFGIFKQRDLAIARLFRQHLEDSRVEFVNLSYAKNSNEFIFKIANEFGKLFRSLTLSVQSMNPATLIAIKRDNMQSNDLAHLLKLSRKYNVGTYSDMILGLPEETLESWCQGLADGIELGQHNHVEIYIANVLENTELNLAQKSQYKIKTVRAKNYQPFSYYDNSGIPEYTELITSTSTMTMDDMVDGYMYCWLLQNFHYAGYSQLLAKYCRNIHTVSYRQFYDTLFDIVKQDTGPLGREYQKNKTMISKLLATGTLGEDIEVHFFYTQSYIVFYQCIQAAVEMSIGIAEQFGPVDNTIINLQKALVLNDVWPPGKIETNYNIDTWKPTPTIYNVTSQMLNLPKTTEDFHYARRGGLIKNLTIQEK